MPFSSENYSIRYGVDEKCKYKDNKFSVFHDLIYGEVKDLFKELFGKL